MTKQESFKLRVRARMATTGERYAAARRSLLTDRTPDSGRVWVSEPELNDERVRAATGRGWDEWCDLIDAWPGHVDGHTAVAAHVLATFDVTGWWAHAVTGGWERITERQPPARPGALVALANTPVRTGDQNTPANRTTD